MSKHFAICSAALFLVASAPAFAEDVNPSDTYHDYDLHCSVGGAAACARPSSPADLNTSQGLPTTASAPAGDPVFKK